MRSAYRVLALLIALGVVLQAASIAFAWFDVISELESGAVFAEDSEGNLGHALHGIIGLIIMPALSLILLIVSFFAKVSGGVKWALFVFGAVVLQVALAVLGRTLGLPALGLLHGANALVLLALAEMAARRANRTEPVATAERRDRVGSVAR